MSPNTIIKGPTSDVLDLSSLHFYAGLFLVTASTLMLQLVQTRILSVVAWYHLAFFAISMAMFGLTGGAVWVYLRQDRFTERTLSYDLSYYSAAYAVVTGVCLLVQMTLTPIVVRSLTSIWSWAEVALCIAIPFFFSGVVVSLALTRSPFPIGRVYGVDLLGAATGCLGVLLVLNVTDGPSAVLWIATLTALGAWFFSRSNIGTAPTEKPVGDFLLSRKKTIVAVLAVCALLNGLTDFGFQPLVAKGSFEDGSSHIFRKWNTFSRVAVYPQVTGTPDLWGPSPKFASHEMTIVQRTLNIDGDAATVAYRFSGNLKEVDFLRYDVTTLAYNLPGRNRVAVIGVGGGRDILSAALFGSHDITGVELNPVFVRLLTREPGFADFTNLNHLDGIKLFVDEGRSWFARSQENFDLVQMSLIDTWAATGAGAFSLSENGLYTVEAWKIFLGRLTDRGVFTVSRWYNAQDPSETGRLLSLAIAALMELGVTVPEQHVFLATAGSMATIIVARQPFTAEDLSHLQGIADLFQYRVIASPSRKPDSRTLRGIVSAQSRQGLEDYTSRQEFDLTPPNDDRPFFFNQVPLTRPIQALRVARDMVGIGGVGGVRAGNLVATATLLILFFISLALVVGTILIPLRSAVKDVGPRLVVGGTLYFLLIGIGFMAVEIALLQRMTVFLGHPIYSLSVSLFTLILATGLGSFLSDRAVLHNHARFVMWAAITGSYILSMPYWLPHLLHTFDSADLATRAAVCVGVIAPPGAMMGFAFPTGMRFVSAIDRKPTPWFWGINGAAGVLASVMAVATSISLGISTTLTVGAICYLLLIPTVLALMPQR